MIGRVYKITTEKGGLVYIGSTIQTLGERLTKHKTARRRWLAGKQHYCASFQVLEFDDAKMELIEELEVADKDELRQREGHYHRTMECVNKLIAGRSQKQYRAEHKEEMNAYSIKYRDEHKEHLNAKHNCDCGGIYSTIHKSRHIKTKKHQDYINQSH